MYSQNENNNCMENWGFQNVLKNPLFNVSGKKTFSFNNAVIVKYLSVFYALRFSMRLENKVFLSKLSLSKTFLLRQENPVFQDALKNLLFNATYFSMPLEKPKSLLSQQNQGFQGVSKILFFLSFMKSASRNVFLSKKTKKEVWTPGFQSVRKTLFLLSLRKIM